MALPSLTPVTVTSRIVLTSTGSYTGVTESVLPYGTYVNSSVPLAEKNEFISGAVGQVAFTYRMLGGAVLDIELTPEDVYSAYEDSCLEYSYIVNLHQAKSVLPTLLGKETGSFDHQGQYLSGSVLSGTLSGSNVALKFPKMQFGYVNRYADGVGTQVGIGGNETLYSGSIALQGGKQSYDLQALLYTSSLSSGELYSGKIKNKKIRVKKVYYLSPRAVWRFYGYYGGLSSIGNLSTYGQYADDSTWQLIPVWQNKAQAAAFEDAIRTRISHYSYKIENNKIRVFPVPDRSFTKLWVEFIVDENPWEESEGFSQGVDGINNVNTLPFANISYNSINSMGKHWIRRYCLATCKIILSQNRGKFQTLPIPGESVTLNHGELASQGKEEQQKLKEELKTILDELTYAKIAEIQAQEAEHINQALTKMPMYMTMG